MGSGLSIAIPALFIIFLTVGLGGLTLVIAWAKIFIELGSNASWNKPKSLQAFTAAVIIESITLPVMWVIPDDLRQTILMVFFDYQLCICDHKLSAYRSIPLGPEKA
jgi:hypothetical protein